MAGKYFHITLDLLPSAKGEEGIFPFHLHLYNPLSEKYTHFLHANSPFTLDQREFIEDIISRGAELAVLINQKETFITHTEIKEEDIKSLQKEGPHEMLVRREELIQKREKKKEAENTAFVFTEQFARAFENDNFRNLIDEAREEILIMDVTLSHTVSLAIYLADNLLHQDNYVNRIIALSYFLAKNCDIKEEQALGDLIVGSYFCHLGHTQIDFNYCHDPHLELSDKKKREYKKHPGYAQHLIRKSGVLISERANTIIYQHHERYDGSGYPEQKKDDFIEPLALVLGASSHVLEYHLGKVTGDPTPIPTIVRNIKNKSLTPGLEIEFGNLLYESLSSLVVNEKEKAKAA
jgi:hypothetical protein